jgi:hypothetical protein
MNSNLFGALNPADFDAETAFEGKLRVFGDRDTEFTIRGNAGADVVVAWAEDRYLLFQSNIAAVKQSIKEWIPQLHRECDFKLVSDPDRLVDALEIDTFNFVKTKKGSEVWFYSNTRNGIDENDDGPLRGHDIVVYFDEKMSVIDIHIDG